VFRGAPTAADAEKVRICNDGDVVGADMLDGKIWGSLGVEENVRVEKALVRDGIDDREVVSVVVRGWMVGNRLIVLNAL